MRSVWPARGAARRRYVLLTLSAECVCVCVCGSGCSRAANKKYGGKVYSNAVRVLDVYPSTPPSPNLWTIGRPKAAPDEALAPCHLMGGLRPGSATSVSAVSGRHAALASTRGGAPSERRPSPAPAPRAEGSGDRTRVVQHHHRGGTGGMRAPQPAVQQARAPRRR